MRTLRFIGGRGRRRGRFSVARGGTKDVADAGSDRELEECVVEKKVDDDLWAVKDKKTVEDLNWNRTCKDMAAETPNLLV